MGSSQTKPEFVSVLADQQVKHGHNVTLKCEANTEDVTAEWEKSGCRLQCVYGKHTVDKRFTTFTLNINNVQKEDEGKYTLKLTNKAGTASCSAMVIVEIKEWRTIEWKQDPMIRKIRDFKIKNEEVRELRFLLHGPIGAGKSSIINTIKSIFEEHQFINCLAASDSDATGTSFTTKYQKFSIGTLPFAFYDVMGLEKDNKDGRSKGARSDDIINALKGHIPDDYEFKDNYPMSKENVNYISDPTLNNKIHCLVSVIAADKVSIMDNEVIQKMKDIRAEASKLGIPQLVFVTKMDKVCVLAREDLTKTFQSKKIKEKMEECSTKLGVPMNCTFPMKNYHEETKMNEKLNCLVLEAFTQAVESANDYVKKFSHKE
ncbi:interferon-induced protein 44-like [Colossoma macropomum]|uniref:interferon-induced protein 44-like n=1 Tax=Colossoma macropomum TaxID=42526 RepID=UPI001865560D|nr:interferon-induced protein 44-like [Colossoma macropomum]